MALLRYINSCPENSVICGIATEAMSNISIKKCRSQSDLWSGSLVII